jgi:ElaB/YqjD/DUF883 family membrane-anchored ribosome-binding protein
MADENQTGQGPMAPPQGREKAERGVTHGGEAAVDLGSAAGAMTDEYLGRAEGIWDDARHRSERYVRENPTKAVFAALGVGFLLGFTFPR